ncbi:toll/interleukin-1 receptor domain-containing protein [Shewanella xiamenensis]|uniref:toll/interleukin-1 receptor domain-containing protein n=1 Tax=Shewanella xiamenensis TaxID=332186 RepID=UPI0004D7B289|nr:toll/interleukin-1 receptor domain-containing protein [Shewanella xiamenensis]KEK26824.1 sefir domain protein [Shewanella xiamenensis]
MQVPKVFFSYSHDSEEHKAWVLALATRLEENGVAVTLDQWDLRVGDDLPYFMESGLTDADRVVLICTESYVKKANDMRSGGVGYEKMIITAQIMADLGSNRVIPIVVNNDSSNKTPTFVSSKLYLSFEPSDYENSYCELISNLWGKSVKPRPKRGSSPFAREVSPINPITFDVPASFSNPATKSKVTVNPTANNGRYWVGEGEMAFELSWSRCGSGSIWLYNDTESIHSLSIVPESFKEISDIVDATDSSFYLEERSSNLRVGDIAVLQNTNGYYLALKVEQVLYRSRQGDDKDELTISYVIAPAKSTSFSRFA